MCDFKSRGITNSCDLISQFDVLCDVICVVHNANNFRLAMQANGYHKYILFDIFHITNWCRLAWPIYVMWYHQYMWCSVSLGRAPATCHISPPGTWAAFFLWVSACFTILSSRINPFPHTSQVKGFSPVCRHICLLRSDWWLNCLGQTSHL